MAVFMFGLRCWLMCCFSELTGSYVSHVFLPALAFFQWTPKPCAIPSDTDNGKSQVKETSPFPSLHNEVVASFTHLQWANTAFRVEFNSAKIDIKHQALAFVLGMQSWVIFWLSEGAHVLIGSIVFLDLHHTMFYDVGGGVRRKGYRLLQELHLRALNESEGIREVYLEEVIPELGFGGWIREASRRKGERGSFIQSEGRMKQNWRHGTWFRENGIYTLNIYLDIWNKYTQL